MTNDGARWARTPGQGAYARHERERRWLLPAGAEPPRGAQGCAILDRYLSGTTLRLRTMRPLPDGAPVHKLTQKVPRPDEGPSSVSLTTVYLSPAEHALLSGLPGSELRKVRYAVLLDGRDAALDVFQGRLHGLVTCEVECADEEDDGPREVPSAWLEVTYREELTGGALAALDAHELGDLLDTLRPRI